MTATNGTTAKIDVSALEAAKKELKRNYPWSSAFNELDYVMPKVITAFSTAIEPQLRQKLKAFEMEAKAEGYGVGGAVDEARAELFALFGLEA